jgi:hypothetical protein
VSGRSADRAAGVLGLNWGATLAEREAPLPCDDLLRRPRNGDGSGPLVTPRGYLS